MERAWAWNGLGTIAIQLPRRSTASHRRLLPQGASLPRRISPSPIMPWRRANRPWARKRKLAAIFARPTGCCSRNPVPDLNPHYTINARASAKAMIAFGATGDLRRRHSHSDQAGAELPDEFLSPGARQFHRMARSSVMARAARSGAPCAPMLRDIGHIGHSTVIRRRTLLACRSRGLAGHRCAWKPPRARRSRNPMIPSGAMRAPPIRLQSTACGPSSRWLRPELGDFAGAEAMIAPLRPIMTRPAHARP